MGDRLFDLNGKVALVTGSSQGLGKILVEGLARNGVKVIINGRNREKAQATVDEFNRKGYDAYLSVFDVTNSGSISKAAEEIKKQLGTPDIIINNAGIQIRKNLENFPEQDWDALIDTNLKSAFLVSKAFIKPMIERGSGKVVNICSMQSELGRATVSPYAAAKGGLGIGPGYFKTELTRALYENPEFDHWLKARTPAERWGDPKELVGALLFLSSEASSFVNGQVIYVDGGITASI